MAAVTAALSVFVPASAFGVAQVGNDQTLSDMDVRAGTLRRALLEKRRSRSRRFRSVESLRHAAFDRSSRRGSWRANVRGATAVEAARNWVEANKSLLGIASTSNLRLYRDSVLGGGVAHAGQPTPVFEGLPSADGLVAPLRSRAARPGAGASRTCRRASRVTMPSAGRRSFPPPRPERGGRRTPASTLRSWRSGAPPGKANGARSTSPAWRRPSRPGWSRSRPFGVASPAYEAIVADMGSRDMAYSYMIDARSGATARGPTASKNSRTGPAGSGDYFTGRCRSFLSAGRCRPPTAAARRRTGRSRSGPTCGRSDLRERRPTRFRTSC